MKTTIQNQSSDKMEFTEVYCSNCNKILGRYNTKFYNEEKIAELINDTYSTHIKNGHQVIMRKFEKN
ncbi:MAG: hypothetical protein ACE5RQ_04700 [Nitrosopumilus sp.]|nr:hypothetical protein [Nitrosopumilus sp.]